MNADAVSQNRRPGGQETRRYFLRRETPKISFSLYLLISCGVLSAMTSLVVARTLAKAAV